MTKYLKTILWILALLSLPTGFFTGKEHVFFFWYQVPLMDAVFGVLGALLLVLLTRILAFIAFKREDFDD